MNRNFELNNSQFLNKIYIMLFWNPITSLTMLHIQAPVAQWLSLWLLRCPAVIHIDIMTIISRTNTTDTHSILQLLKLNWKHNGCHSLSMQGFRLKMLRLHLLNRPSTKALPTSRRSRCTTCWYSFTFPISINITKWLKANTYNMTISTSIIYWVIVILLMLYLYHLYYS